MQQYSYAFGHLPYFTTSSSYGVTTATFDITAFLSAFHIPFSQADDIRTLVSYFYIDGSSLGESGLSELDIYNVSITATFSDATTRILRPSSAIFDPGQLNWSSGGGGHISNASNAVDGDSATFAAISADTWGPLTISGNLRVTNFL